MQYLLVEHPFAPGFSQTCKAKRVFAASFFNCKDSDGKLVYGVQGIVEKAAKKRFGELVVFMKGFISCIPFESGTDDVDSGTTSGTLTGSAWHSFRIGECFVLNFLSNSCKKECRPGKMRNT